MDTYKERVPKENSKNSLSRAGAPAREGSESRGDLGSTQGSPEGDWKTAELQEYFGAQKLPPRKRTAELAAYRGLQSQFPEAQIALCLSYLQRKGIPGTGEACHSPMAFLAQAMNQTLTLAEGEAKKAHALAERSNIEAQERERAAAQEAEELRLQAEREEAFARAFPSDEEQLAAIAKYSAQFAGLVKDPEVLRRLAIGGWSGGRSMDPCE
jgi:hypothetical protein